MYLFPLGQNVVQYLSHTTLLILLMLPPRWPGEMSPHSRSPVGMALSKTPAFGVWVDFCAASKWGWRAAGGGLSSVLLLARGKGRGASLHARDIISFLTTAGVRETGKFGKMDVDRGPYLAKRWWEPSHALWPIVEGAGHWLMNFHPTRSQWGLISLGHFYLTFFFFPSHMAGLC